MYKPNKKQLFLVNLNLLLEYQMKNNNTHEVPSPQYKALLTL